MGIIDAEGINDNIHDIAIGMIIETEKLTAIIAIGIMTMLITDIMKMTIMDFMPKEDMNTTMGISKSELKDKRFATVFLLMCWM